MANLADFDDIVTSLALARVGVNRCVVACLRFERKKGEQAKLELELKLGTEIVITTDSLALR